MKLTSVYTITEAPKILYEWLKERSSEEDRFVNISHRKLPTWQKHLKFFYSQPYRHWFLVEVEKRFVGYIFATDRNEVGIVLKKDERDKGYGTQAVRMLIENYKPLPEIPGKRSGNWLANINPENKRSIAMFEKLGFAHIQNTLCLASTFFEVNMLRLWIREWLGIEADKRQHHQDHARWHEEGKKESQRMFNEQAARYAEQLRLHVQQVLGGIQDIGNAGLLYEFWKAALGGGKSAEEAYEVARRCMELEKSEQK